MWSSPSRFSTSLPREISTKNEKPGNLNKAAITSVKSPKSHPLSTSLHPSPHAAVAAKVSRPSTDQPAPRQNKKYKIFTFSSAKTPCLSKFSNLPSPSQHGCAVHLRPGLGTTTTHAREFLSKHYSLCLEDKSTSTRTGPPCSSLSIPIL